MAGATVEDTKLGRETIRMSFAWALAAIDQLPPGAIYEMTLEKDTPHGITFRYYIRKKS